MKAHKSALKHGISENAGIYAAEHNVYVSDLDDDNPARQFRLGFDPNGRLLELVVLRFDSGNELLIHAMKARPQYVDLL
ncbi:MAG: toxin [Rhodococcus sp. (in: high G+C Gram-positive bacteria)]|uniref:toxin n=1 Tax=Rhodococcus sp. TaxID=1831 RepID=UPI002ADCCAB5|nr:toxin [Rhodococcus sp. (in: high G+C Gram-positive bacteria)]